MKNLLYFLGSLLATLVTAFLVHHWLSSNDDPGYVLIGFGGWSLETSMVFFAVGAVLSFFALYVFFRFLGWSMRLPARLKAGQKTLKFNRSQEGLIAGLVDSAAGNWENAEKTLLKHAANSGAPLLHYLTAARAAQSRGALDKRDEYLQKAIDQSNGADLAVGLTQAELHLSANQFEQALETLTKLHSIDPSHGVVLKLQHQIYQQLGDWEGLLKLIPALHKNKVLMEAEVKLLETETFSQLLKQAAASRNAARIQTVWESIPPYLQNVRDIFHIYFAAMINAGAGAKIEALLVKKIAEQWNDTLIELFACIEDGDVENQLVTAERWLLSYPDNAVLLRAAGKLCIKNQIVDKALKYLSRSLDSEPTVAAYHLLGDLFFEMDDKDKASKCYKRGLELAANEIENHAELMSK